MYVDVITISTIIIYIFSEMATLISIQKSKRQRVCDLLNALISPKQISGIVGVSKKTVYNVKKKMIMRKTITRKTGSGESNKKRTKTFIKTLKFKIQKNPTKSMRKMARELKMDSKTVRNSVIYDLKLNPI